MEDTLLLITFVITAVAIGAGMLAMAIGAMTSGRCLRGSCGGPGAHDHEGNAIACANCPNRKAAG